MCVNKQKISIVLLPLLLIIIFVVLSYNNVVFLHRSLNPVLLIPSRDIQLSTGYADITGTTTYKHGWHVDLANPAYLEWPVNTFIGKSLRAGYIPIVMPYQSLGVPLIGQYCHRVLSPYQMVENLFFPYGYDFFLLLRLVLAGLFAYLFIRPLCRRVESALVTAIGYGLGSIMVIYSNHEEVVNVAMLLPILIWAVRAFFDRPTLARACWLTLALALVHTAGQPEIQLYLLFLSLLYGLTRLFTMPGGSRRSAFLYSLAAIFLSAVIAAPQIILFLQFHHEAWTFHPPGGSLGIQSPMTIHRFLFTFFPKLRQTPWPWSYRTINLLWDWVGGYFGLGVLFLAARAFRRPRRNRRDIFLFGFYFLFILAKNLGWSPAQLLGIIPPFDQTWSPRWAAATWSFALAVLAGFGLDNLLDRSPLIGSYHHQRAGLIEPPISPPDHAQRKGDYISRLFSILKNPLISSALLIFVIILSFIFWWQGSLSWQGGRMREYIIFNGSIFILLAGGAALLYFILGQSKLNYFKSIPGVVKYTLIHQQTGMIALLAAIVFAALRWFPTEHYFFHQPEPFAAYLFAAPILLLALSGLFFIAASPSNIGTVFLSAIAIPAALIGGWADIPIGPIQVIFWIIFALAIGSFFLFNRRYRIRRILIPIFSLPLLGILVALSLLATFFPEDSGEADRLLRFHYYFAILLLGVFSGLSWWRERGGSGCGWYFLILIWAEMTIYIPKNHSDRYLLIDHIPFLICLLTLIGFSFWFRKRPISGKKVTILLSTVLILSCGSLLIIDNNSSKHLPAACTPREPLPYISFLNDHAPDSLVGIGRILAPNFASAHGITDMRGCDSMNTRSYQFFLENILQVVPRANSYSLWFTGDNPIKTRSASPYGSSESEHLQAFQRAFPFYILSSARYILCHPGALDRIGESLRRAMKKIYDQEIEIWEIPALPSAYIAHKAEVISMISDIRRWRSTVSTDEEVMKGNRVILEDDPPREMLESERDPTDRAELIMGENPNRMEINFHSKKPGYLVISRSYTNLLRAYLDGEELPILKANGPFMAIPIPGSPKDRVLKLTYLSLTTKLSFGLSILGILVVVVGLVMGRRKKS